MKKLGKIVSFVIHRAFFNAPSIAAIAKGAVDETVAMVKRAVAYPKGRSKEKVFAEFANPNNTQRGLIIAPASHQ